jgi:4-hydroxyphenylpyruvate dioxygenase-like putative hemolysin
MSGTIDHIAIRAPKDQFDRIVDWYKKALARLTSRR